MSLFEIVNNSQGAIFVRGENFSNPESIAQFFRELLDGQSYTNNPDLPHYHYRGGVLAPNNMNDNRMMPVAFGQIASFGWSPNMAVFNRVRNGDAVEITSTKNLVDGQPIGVMNVGETAFVIQIDGADTTPVRIAPGDVFSIYEPNKTLLNYKYHFIVTDDNPRLAVTFVASTPTLEDVRSPIAAPPLRTPSAVAPSSQIESSILPPISQGRNRGRASLKSRNRHVYEYSQEPAPPQQLTLKEKTLIIALRAGQIADGLEVYINPGKVTNSFTLAQMEFAAAEAGNQHVKNALSFIKVQRRIGNNVVEIPFTDVL